VTISWKRTPEAVADQGGVAGRALIVTYRGHRFQQLIECDVVAGKAERRLDWACDKIFADESVETSQENRQKSA
jgi:hypothetical protein